MSRVTFFPNSQNIALFTDLYELNMLQSYFEKGLTEKAVFSLFIRTLPAERNYFLACGLSDLLAILETMHFSDETIDYLESLKILSNKFLKSLRSLKFEGDVFAVPEGTPIFENEPIVEIVAPIGQAQFIETLVINQIHLQTLLASKATRVVEAAKGHKVVDFGARRMHGFDAAIKAARAFYIAGIYATSNVLAGKFYGIPIAGTMAHSYVQAFDREIDAFRAFSDTYPDSILLIDTYDTINGVENVIRLARELGQEFRIRGVRLDSGDLVELAKQTRKCLDRAGLHSVQIIASGGLDEFKIADILEKNAPVDGFGVGTAMGVSSDVPALDIAYKLSSYDNEGRMKLSTGKETLPGQKQVFRIEREGTAIGDIIGCYGENISGRPLLSQVMKNGQRIAHKSPKLEDIRNNAFQEIQKLPLRVRNINPTTHPFNITISDKLKQYKKEVKNKLLSNL